MRCPDYPIPNYAAYIWLVSDTIHLGLPGPGAATSTAHFPATVEGLSLALAVLRSRGKANANDLRIGNAAAPTQWQVEKWLKDNGKMPLSKDPLKALAELGEVMP